MPSIPRLPPQSPGRRVRHGRSNETKFRFMTVVLYFRMSFLVGGQSLTPPAGPRPRDHKPGEGRTLSSEDFERPCRPIAACAPLANSSRTRNYRPERRASRGRGLSESGANNGLAWLSLAFRCIQTRPVIRPQVTQSGSRPRGMVGHVQFRSSIGAGNQTFIGGMDRMPRGVDGAVRGRCLALRHPHVWRLTDLTGEGFDSPDVRSPTAAPMPVGAPRLHAAAASACASAHRHT